jgi:hypothetical protein
MYIKQSVSLIIVSMALALSGGIANADDMEVKAGNTSVSIQNGRVEVDNSGSDVRESSSWLDRLGWGRGIFRSRDSSPTINSTSTMNCDRSSSSQQSSNSSSGGVSQSSSSSTTMSCN